LKTAADFFAVVVVVVACVVACVVGRKKSP